SIGTSATKARLRICRLRLSTLTLLSRKRQEGSERIKYKVHIGPASTPLANQHGASKHQTALSNRNSQRAVRRYDWTASKPSSSISRAMTEKLAANQNTACW